MYGNVFFLSYTKQNIKIKYNLATLLFDPKSLFFCRAQFSLRWKGEREKNGSSQVSFFL